MHKRGLIVGKFYPPHKGHKFLIATGRAQVDELTVIVCQKPNEKPSGDLRAAWLREIHPDVNVLLINDVDDEQDSKIWAENSIRWLGYTPDVVFTSEDYGDRFAFHLGCLHILVDKARTIVPVSGTKVRNHPMQYWDFLEPPVRGWYARRVCLVGAESTGKTTLAKALAAHYHTNWVAEYGREYTEKRLAEKRDFIWTSDEFTHIAVKQCELENEAARHANKILFCDTDAFATAIWHRRYMNERSPQVENIATQHRRPDLYLLTDVNTPFEDDGTRDGELIRNWMHEFFVAELQSQRRQYKFLSGSHEQRLACAISIIDKFSAKSL